MREPSLSGNVFDTPIGLPQGRALPRQWRGSTRMEPHLELLHGPARSHSALAAGNIPHDYEAQSCSLSGSLERNQFPQLPARWPHTGQNGQARGLTCVGFLLQATDCLSFTSVIRDHRHDDQAVWVFFTDEASEVGLEGRKLSSH